MYIYIYIYMYVLRKVKQYQYNLWFPSFWQHGSALNSINTKQLSVDEMINPFSEENIQIKGSCKN